MEIGEVPGLPFGGVDGKMIIVIECGEGKNHPKSIPKFLFQTAP